MAVSEQTPYIEYTANGTTTGFALEFYCDNQDHLIVLVDDVEPVVGAWSLNGGAVIFGTAPEDGKKITIQRNTPFSRNTDYQSYNNSFRPHSVNGDFDRVWLKLQELGLSNWLLKNYVDRKDDELKSFLMAEIQAQGVALDQLDEYYNYLMQRLAQIAVDKGWDASFVVDGDKNQKQINADFYSSLSDRYTKAETYSKTEVDDLTYSVAGGKYSFTTFAKFDAAKATIPANSMVNIDEAPTGTTTWGQGLNTWDGITLSKSVNDPLTQAKLYSDAKVFIQNAYKKFDVIAECYVDENSFTRLKTLIDSNQNIFFDTRIEESTVDISDLKSKVDGQSFYKKIIGIASIYLDEDGSSRLKEETVTAKFTSYISTEQKQLIAGTGISLLETEQSITIEASDIVYETPHEYVLCLIAGQSNASYFGGDAALAPQIPNNVCYVWDNTYNTLREINDGSSVSTTCKQTYGPALSLEFYKQTGIGLIIVNSAVGSTAQAAAADNGSGNWDVSGTLRQTAVDRFNACENYLNSNNYCYQRGFICWTQGERDGQEIQIGTITKEQYKTALSTMIDFFKTNLGSKLPFILTTTAYYASFGDNVGSKAVRAAQMETAHEKSGAYVGYTGAVKFFERGLMSDSVHYNQIGKNIIGKQLAKIASQLSAGVN